FYIPGSLRNIEILDETVIPYGAFMNTPIEEVRFTTVEEIRDYAFYTSKIKNVNTEDIDLHELRFNNTVKSIGSYAFANVKDINWIYVNSTIGKQRVPSSSDGYLGDYVFANNDLDANGIVIENYELGDHMFDGTQISTLTIPANVIYVGTHVFANNAKLTGATIKNEILGEYMFYHNTGLKRANIPANIKQIGYAAFGSCPGIASMELPFVGKHRYDVNASKFEGLFGYVFGHQAEADVKNNMAEIVQTFEGNGVETVHLDILAKQNVSVDDTIYTSFNLDPSNGGYHFFVPKALRSITMIDDTVIGDSAFMDLGMVGRFTLYKDTTTIKSHAFENCDASDFNHIEIPAKVSSIEEYAFKNCYNLSTVGYNNNQLKKISEGTFYNCYSLSEAIILDSVTLIEEYAYYNCISLSDVLVHANVREIASKAFGGCIGLTEMNLPFVGGKPYAELISIIEDESKTQEEKDLARKMTLFGYIFGELEPGYERGFFEDALYTGHDLVSSDRYDEYIIAHQLSYEFYIPKNLKKVTLNNIETIGEYSFSNVSNLEHVVITNENTKLTDILDHAFDGASSLLDLFIPNTVSTLGEFAFANCSSLETVVFETNNKVLEIIPEYVFANDAKITNMKVADSLESDLSGLDNTLPDSVKEIHEGALFNNASLDSFVVGRSVEMIEQKVFGGCVALENLTLPFVGQYRYATNPEDTTTLGHIFSDTLEDIIVENQDGLAAVVQNELTYYIPKSLNVVTITDDTKIKDYGFENIESLKTVLLPSGYRGAAGLSPFVEVGAYAFNHCTGLEGIDFPHTTTTIGEHAFDTCSNEEFTELFIPNSVSTMGEYVFANCSSLNHVVFEINNNVLTEIPAYAFANDEKIVNMKVSTSITSGYYVLENTFPDSVTTINEGALFNNASLEAFIVGNNVETIKNNVFGGCVSLEDLTLPFVGEYRYFTNPDDETTFGYIFSDSLEGILEGNADKLYAVEQNGKTYYLPKSFKYVTITNDTKIKDYAFENVTKLEWSTLPTGYDAAHPFVEVGAYAFNHCTGLEGISFPNTTTTIGEYAFNNCANYEFYQIYIPASVETIGEYAFKDMYSLECVTFADDINIKEIATGTFYNDYRLTTVFTKDQQEEDIITVPTTVTTLGDVVFFNNTSATEVILPDTITHIGASILGGAGNVTKLTTPFIGDEEHGICGYDPTYDSENTLFGYFFGTSEDYENYRESIKNSFKSVVQKYGKLESNEVTYYIPTKLTDIEITNTEVVHYGTFYNVDGLKNVKLPEILKVIEDYAFYNATDLLKVSFGETNTNSELREIGESAFENAIQLICFNTDDEEAGVVIPTLVTTLNDKAFMNCNSIVAVRIPSYVGTNDGTVGAYVFAGCDRLASIEINNHWIGAHMFDNEDNFPVDFDIEKEDYEIPALREVTIPANVTQIDEYAFANNSELRIANIDNKVLGEYQFYNCPRLASIILPENLESIGEGAFGDCISLVEIWIPFVGHHAYSEDGREALLGYIFGTKSKYSDAVASTNALVHRTEQMINETDKEVFYIPTSLRI
ncbi:MAG: leucine-rich repeat domain-containing protein, partial [Anaeroplasmataceae bacterium]|nr:leucine-rich repeat domain-containing protein [Anaeroplasmataceae bacterium]